MPVLMVFLLHDAKLLSRKVKWIYTPISHCQIPYPKSFYNFFTKMIKQERKKKALRITFLRKTSYIHAMSGEPSIYSPVCCQENVPGRGKHSCAQLPDLLHRMRHLPTRLKSYALPFLLAALQTPVAALIANLQGALGRGEQNLLAEEKGRLRFHAVSRNLL